MEVSSLLPWALALNKDCSREKHRQQLSRATATATFQQSTTLRGSSLRNVGLQAHGGQLHGEAYHIGRQHRPPGNLVHPH